MQVSEHIILLLLISILIYENIDKTIHKLLNVTTMSSEMKVPFKLYFKIPKEIGRTNAGQLKTGNLKKTKLSTCTMHKIFDCIIVSIITPKFYSIHQEGKYNTEEIKQFLAQLVVLGPREKYMKPQTENQK